MAKFGIREDAVNRPWRFGQWVQLVVIATGLPLVIGGTLHLIIGEYLKFDGAITLLYILSFFPAGLVFGKVLPAGWVSIPQMQFFVTNNPFSRWFNKKGNPNLTYIAGEDGPTWIWEQRSQKGNGTLEVITIEWEEAVPGAETQFLLDASYQFRVDVPDRYIGLDENTLRAGAIDLMRADAAARLAEKNGDEGKNEIEAMNQEINDKFGLGDSSSKDPKVSAFEDEYGIHSVATTIAGIDFPEAVQKTRNARDEARQVLIGVANMYGMRVDKLKVKMESGEITTGEYNEMLDRFAAFSENATMNISAFKVNNMEAFAEVFGRAFGRAFGGK